VTRPLRQGRSGRRVRQSHRCPAARVRQARVRKVARVRSCTGAAGSGAAGSASGSDSAVRPVGRLPTPACGSRPAGSPHDAGCSSPRRAHRARRPRRRSRSIGRRRPAPTGRAARPGRRRRLPTRRCRLQPPERRRRRPAPLPTGAVDLARAQVTPLRSPGSAREPEAPSPSRKARAASPSPNPSRKARAPSRKARAEPTPAGKPQNVALGRVQALPPRHFSTLCELAVRCGQDDAGCRDRDRRRSLAGYRWLLRVPAALPSVPVSPCSGVF
jgi:hypothetical protein